MESEEGAEGPRGIRLDAQYHIHDRQPDDHARPRAATRRAECLQIALGAALLVLTAGCPPTPPNNQFNNTTDPTNNNSSFIGAAACATCHPDVAAEVANTGHVSALSKIECCPPTFPASATRAGVPNPPPGRTFTDISYVVGGFAHNANFVDNNGFLMTDGTAGVNTQWLLGFPPNGTTPPFAPFMPGQTTPLPYDFSCFKCHTTGPQAQTAANPGSQGNLPGIRGTWNEDAVHCEACHGPGSKHPPIPHARLMYPGFTAADCGRCHTFGDDPNVILAGDGFVQPFTQYPQLLASGGHSGFDCTTCHDPHLSTIYDRQNAIRNNCPVCHTDKTLGFHAGVTFVRGDYVEPLSCESCHMAFIGKSGSSGSPAVVGPLAHVGDVRGHIFRIDPDHADSAAMFTPDGTAVLKDAQGRAAVTLDFICLRCHNGLGNAFGLIPSNATDIAPVIHTTRVQ